MFIIPIGDENPTARVPYVNYTLIAINVLLFLGLGFTDGYRELVNQLGFIPSQALPYTYVTSIFLHAGIFHLLGNMLFLWITGDNVEDKLGHLGYLLFYLFCGAMGNLFHSRMIPPNMEGIPCIGASGAISGVLGAYLLLFPKNKINFFYLIYFRPGTFKLASFWAIGFWFVMQFFSHTMSGGVSSVAYGAHIGGFIVGAVISVMLVFLGVITAHWKREHDYMDIAGIDREAHLEDYKTPYQPDQSSHYRTDYHSYRENGEDNLWK